MHGGGGQLKAAAKRVLCYVLNLGPPLTPAGGFCLPVDLHKMGWGKNDR